MLKLAPPRLFLVLAAAALPAAAGVDPGLFQELRWRSLGPFRGGRVLAVAGVPGEPHRFYLGGVNGGVWTTDDAGRTWSPIFDAQPIGSIGALAVAPSRSATIYAGTGEADMRDDISQGDGVYKSTDAGKSWAHVGLRDSQQVGRILVDPKDPERVLVAALGHPYGPNPERGVFRSEDGGRTWKKVLGRNDDTGAIDLAFKPGDARIVYAALWQTRRPPWSVYPPSSGPGGGLFKSTDGGTTWTELLGRGLPERPGRIGLGVSPAEPERLYAMVDAHAGGLYRSDDEGASFTRTSDDARIWGRGWYFGGLAVEPRNADVVYACNTSVHRSTDGGKTFAPVKGAPGGDDYHELWIDPETPERRILGTDQGAVVSLNGGATWSSWYNQPTAQFYRLATDGRFPYWVYGSQQDSGALAIPSRTTTRDGIATMQLRWITPGGENDAIAPDPRDPDVVYGGRVERLDVRTDQTRHLDPPLAFPGHYRSVWTQPLVFSPRDPKVLYFAHQQVFRTMNGGETWSPISGDLTRESPGVPPNLDATTAADVSGAGPRPGVVYAIAPSRAADGDLWVGTDDGLVWKTRDEGAHWVNVTPKALTPWSKVTMLEASRFDGETAYAAVDRHRLDDTAPYLYRTRDGGKTWTLAVHGLPHGSFLNAIREDPRRRGLLYAGTEKGVFVSFDDGESWQPLQNGLPVTSVRDMEVHGDDLVVATHGRGFYALDGIAPLRQAIDVADTPWLYTPGNAVRLRPAGFTGTPLPKDEPMAPNPPFGAAIDYLLKAPPKEPITLTILDDRGQVVRRYSSADKVPPLGRRESVLAPEWLSPPVSLPATPGMHRVFWSIRYPEPRTLARGNSFADGVWAPPGRYTVELVVDGAKLTRPLVVEPDPRMKMPPEAYARQMELARRVEDAREAVALATKEAGELRKRLRARAQRPSPLEVKLLEISDLEETSPRLVPPPPRLASLRFLQEALDALQNAVDGADADPSPDARAGFEKLAKTLESTLARWQELKKEALAVGDGR
jgi:photosystem II stability/assembly factor-like uncharacterized protein